MECKDCKFCEMSIGNKVGWCKRFPPVFNTNNFTGKAEDCLYAWQSPRIGAKDWCGEFEAKI
jgi:hypothetical protein